MEKVVIKISGEVFSSMDLLNNVINQIKYLYPKYKMGIVLGAGNIFRGKQQSQRFGINQTTGDNAGMLATIINGLILKDLLEKESLNIKLLSSIPIPTITDSINQEKINCSLHKDKIIIFVGGTGNPFFTTDTNAVLRAIQMKASIVLKGTKVEGIFDKDPTNNTNAKLIKEITFNKYLEKNLQVMDLTAIALAKKHNLKIKVFNIFNKNSLIRSLQENSYASLISK